MRLVSLVLENVFQYQYVDIPFGPGMTLIIGPNGSGKSNLLLAIRAAISNDICLPGVKADNISQFAAKGAVSRIVLKAVQGDVPFTVCRGLAVSDSWLDCGDEPRLKGDKQINQRLALLLGYDLAVLQELAFVQQGELLASCRETQAGARLARWQRMFSLNWLETCHSAIGDFLSNYTITVPEPSSAELNVKRLGKDTEGDTLRTQLSCLPDFTSYVPSKDDRLEPLRQHRRWKRNKARFLEARQQHQKVTQETTELLQRFRKILEELKPKQEWLDQIAIPLVRAKQTIQRYNEYQTKLIAYSAAKTTADKYDKEIAELQVPVKPGGTYATSAEYARRLGELQVQIQTETEFLAHKPEGGICPHCRQSWVVPEEARRQSQARLQGYQDSTRHLSIEQKFFQTYEQKFADYERRRASLQAVRKNIAVPEPPVVAPRDEVAEKLVLEEVTVANRCRELRLQLQNKDQEQLRLQAQRQLDKYAQQIKSCRKRLKQYKVDRATWEAARELARQLKQGKLQHDTLRTQLAVVESELATLRQQIAETQIKEEAVATKMAFKAELQAAREHLHKERLPKQLLKGRLDQITESMTEILASQPKPFSVSLNKDLALQASFGDGRSQPAYRLSGGQQGKMAMAFWLALNKLIAGVNFLCLDEPTEAMDRENRAALATMLEELRTLGSEEGLQCLVVTHDESLRPCADHVIELTGVGQVEVTL